MGMFTKIEGMSTTSKALIGAALAGGLLFAGAGIASAANVEESASPKSDISEWPEDGAIDDIVASWTDSAVDASPTVDSGSGEGVPAASAEGSGSEDPETNPNGDPWPTVDSGSGEGVPAVSAEAPGSD